MKVYNFVENKNVLALFPTLRKLLAANQCVSGLGSARLGSLAEQTVIVFIRPNCPPSVLQMLWLFLHLTLF